MSTPLKLIVRNAVSSVLDFRHKKLLFLFGIEVFLLQNYELFKYFFKNICAFLKDIILYI